MMENTENSFDSNENHKTILTEVLVGLSKGQKSIPPKFLYDRRGSEIFEKITELQEYYLCRAENQILRSYAREMSRLTGPNVLIIEPGSGIGEKVRHLLGRLVRPRGYVPIEISREALSKATEEVHRMFPRLDVFPLKGDFTEYPDMPTVVKEHRGKKIVFFPGSTIGNLNPEEAVEFLKHYGDVVGSGGGFLIGVDLKKDSSHVLKAYNDSIGLTATFNLNLLERLNREAKASFVLNNFDHRAVYNNEEGRVEMHLVSKVPQQVQVHQSVFRFQEGETIHTENSYKYSVEEFCEIASRAKLKIRKYWQDPEKLFCVYYFERD